MIEDYTELVVYEHFGISPDDDDLKDLPGGAHVIEL